MTKTNELKASLIRRGISLEDLSDALGISRVSLSKKMNNHREFKVSEIVKITQFLQLTRDERDVIFFGLKGDS